MDLTKLSLKQLNTALSERQISVKEVVGDYLERAKQSDLNAYITLTEETALQSAQTAQKLFDSGESTALTGIPCSIKDNICTAEIKTTNGSKMLENFVPFYDADLIRTLKSQGFVMLGKTNMDEFAMGNSNRTSYFGNVRNPHDRERVSGGSSGGSAAAVAADLCCYSIGTDTGGSIRQPAAYCGITGLKPTYGRISRTGVTAFAGSFDTVGPLAKTAEDCAIIMEALTGEKSYASKIGNGIKGMKIALIKELFTENVDVNVRESVSQTLDFLRSQGAQVEKVSLPALDYAAPAYFTLASAEGVSALSRFDGVKYGLRGEGATYDERLRDSRTRGLGEEVKRRIMLGNFVLSGENMNTYFRKGLAIRQQITREFNALLNDYDVAVSPTSSRSAFSLDEPGDFVKIYSSTLYTVPMNLAGLPCVSTPGVNSVKFDKPYMPIGVSLTGRKFDEATILQVADCIERGRNR